MHINPDEWLKSGGQSTQSRLGSLMVTTATDATLAKIEEFCVQIVEQPQRNLSYEVDAAVRFVRPEDLVQRTIDRKIEQHCQRKYGLKTVKRIIPAERIEFADDEKAISGRESSSPNGHFCDEFDEFAIKRTIRERKAYSGTHLTVKLKQYPRHRRNRVA